MPKIKLKEKSPEYEKEAEKQVFKFCDNTVCCNIADYKAPKSRNNKDHYWFCLNHVKEYNRNWDYFSGMAEDEILSYIRKAAYGDRPTWKSAFSFSEAAMKNKAWNKFRASGDDDDSNDGYANYSKQGFSVYSEEHKAMAIMGISPPLTLEAIKSKYKELAKKHHPDRNNGCKESEEMLKKIILAYTTLKKAYEKYQELPDNKKA